MRERIWWRRIVPTNARPALLVPVLLQAIIWLTVDVTEMKLSRQLSHVSSHLFLDIVSHTNNDVPKIKKNSIGPATSLSSMIC